MKPVGLQSRLNVGLTITVLVVWLVVTVSTSLRIKHELDEAFDRSLRDTAYRLLSLSTTTGASGLLIAPPADLKPARSSASEVKYRIVNQQGDTLLESRATENVPFSLSLPSGLSSARGYRLYQRSTSDGERTIQLAEPLKHRRDIIIDAASDQLLPLILLLPLSLLGVHWMVRRTLQPVNSLRREISQRGAGDLSEIIATGLPEELAPIVDDVNRLLVRVRSTLDAERSFTANSAHELRTPLAGALAHTHRLLSETSSGRMREHGEAVEASLNHLANLSVKLMQLARAEGGALLTAEPNDLLPVLLHVVDEFERDSQWQGRLSIERADSLHLMSRMDGDAFGILLRNLIENALRHSPAASPVEIRLTKNGLLRIINTGNTVAAGKLAVLTRRFERGDTGADGAGLGLAIASAIAGGAGVEMTLMSPVELRASGFEVRLKFAGAQEPVD